MIRVDGDACPVKNGIVKIGKKYDVDIVVYIDVNHELSNEKYDVITVDQGIDSVDMAIISDMKKNDIIITNDYGLASLVLGNKGYAMDANGREFNHMNIDRLLFERHLHKEIRQRKKRHKGPKKRSGQSNIEFEKEFEKLLLRVL